MAMSFSRPDPSLPASVADAVFPTGRRGFDQSEVRDFLRMVAAELGRLQERERFLERELRHAQSSPDLSSAALSDDDLARLLGEETARVIASARASAGEIKAKAEQAAARMVSEASDEANRVRQEADLESSRRRADAASDAAAEIDMAKQQGREMVNEARAYRERVLSELARRRELAREQIEQLLHGRGRLMQSFERARVVAVEVVAELEPLGEPDEYVNLTPTTGPVPVMVPARQESASEPDVAAEPEPDVALEPEPTSDVSAEPERDAHAAAFEAFDRADEADELPGPEPVGQEPAEPTDAAEPDPAEDRDDVVVDLFARIRAGSDDESESEHGSDTDSAADRVDEIAVDEELVEVPDAEVVEETAEQQEHDPTPFDLREEHLTPLIVASAKKLKRTLADEQNSILGVLRRKANVVDLDDILPSPAAHLAEYADSITDELTAAAQAGATSASGSKRKLAAAKSTLARSQAVAVIDEYLVAPLRERLERAIVAGEGDNQAITKASRAVYREWKTQRIDDTLDDVLRAAHGRGRLAGFSDGTQVIWTVDSSAPSCPECDDNVLGGAIVAGSEFPTGDVFAPAHPGCRCLLTPADG